MSLRILGNNAYLWQWDTGRQIVVEDADCCEVHFCNETVDCALKVMIKTADDGSRVADVPDILLQTAKPISVYLFMRNDSGTMTRTMYTFQVYPRTRPDGYIYTEQERMTWETLDKRIDEAIVQIVAVQEKVFELGGDVLAEYVENLQDDMDILEASVSGMEQQIADIIADLDYTPIEITAISDNVGTVEKGVAVATLDVSWTLNKDPVSQTLGGETIPNDVRSRTVDMTGRTSVTLTVTDERGHTDSASAGYNAYNGVYVGVLEDGVTIDSAAILSLNKKVQNSRGVTFTADCTGGKRIAYAIPASGYGTPVFQDVNTKLPIDMTQVPGTVSFRNIHDYTTDYKVWLSTHALDRAFTVSVT